MHFIPAASMHFPFSTMFSSSFFFFFFLSGTLSSIPLSVTSIKRLDNPSFWLQLPRVRRCGVAPIVRQCAN